MANEPIITITGNLTADPEISITTTGRTRAAFTVAATPRNFDKQQNQWVDGETLFMRCTAWGEVGDHIIESLGKGTRVIVQGRLTQRSWQTEQGEKRTMLELQVDEIGASLRYAVAKVTRIQNNNPGYTQQGARGQWQQPTQQQPVNGGASDPWATQQPTQQPQQQQQQQELLTAEPTYNQAPPF